MSSFLEKIFSTQRRPFLLYAALVAMLTGLVYSAYFSPALYYDDWGQFVNNFYRGNLPWFIPGYVRPLSFATYRLETELFGMNLTALMILRIFMLMVEGVLFFSILEKLKVFSTPLNFICSLIILVSPVDMSRMWLVMEPLRLIFVQIYMLCMIFYREKKSIAAFIIGLIFGFVLLLNYEAQLGLIIAFPVFLFTLDLLKEKKRNWLLLVPLFIGIGYLLFRALGSLFGIVNFHASQSITLMYILRQIRNGLVCHITGWLLPVSTDATIRYIAIAAVVLALVFYLVHLVKYGLEKDIKKRFFRALILIVVGGVFWLAGYFPWIAYGVPSLIDYFSSRAHNYSIPGAMICFLAIVEFLGSIIRVSKNRKQIISAMLALPLIAIGVFSQMAIQKENKILWHDYKTMWTGIFEAVPNIKDNTHVVLIISPDIKDLRYGEREYFTSASFNVETSVAFAMFYANDKVEGEFMYETVELADTPTIHDEGIRNPPTYSGTIPYSDILFIAFDRDTGKVKVIRDLKEQFGIVAPDYQPDNHMDDRPITKPTLRYIFNQ